MEWVKYIESFVSGRVTLGVKAIPIYPVKAIRRILGDKSDFYLRYSRPLGPQKL